MSDADLDELFAFDEDYESQEKEVGEILHAGDIRGVLESPVVTNLQQNTPKSEENGSNPAPMNKKPSFDTEAAEQRLQRRRQLLDNEFARAKAAADAESDALEGKDIQENIASLQAQLSGLQDKIIAAEAALVTLQQQAAEADRRTEQSLAAIKDDIASVESESEALQVKLRLQQAELARLDEEASALAAAKETRAKQHTEELREGARQYARLLQTLPYPSPQAMRAAVDRDIAEYCKDREAEVRQTNDRIGVRYDSGAKSVQFSNGSVKYILPSGEEFVTFFNGDLKRTWPDGAQLYLYADVGTLTFTAADGAAIHLFSATGQVESHLDGRVEVYDANGEKRVVQR
ncbi:T-complex protein 10 C-terminus [Carpediemonas membranifera]|uniref:T-complex protein 10 C-terminus n=1 Tax=Carpediemonas membranifera TaxID=201153 RepID=A0A8J6B162_9EUKA|nr:T-complex protein 10 C-terminus [Carpediemonas membranifera]|eukprot:KAG9393423.1 T-complex protein 10 C-terminus [Carpediemonas membranifera]